MGTYFLLLFVTRVPRISLSTTKFCYWSRDRGVTPVLPPLRLSAGRPGGPKNPVPLGSTSSLFVFKQRTLCPHMCLRISLRPDKPVNTVQGFWVFHLYIPSRLQLELLNKVVAA